MIFKEGVFIMDWCEKDVPYKHRAVIVDQPVPLGEIVERLMKEYDAAQFAPEDIPSMQMHRFNAIHLPGNDELKLAADQLQVKAIKIPINHKTRKYTEKDFVSRVHEDGDEEYIYLAYEEQVGYHYSNSNMLFLEVALEKGVTQKEIERDTLEYKDYMHYLKAYHELYAENS